MLKIVRVVSIRDKTKIVPISRKCCIASCTNSKSPSPAVTFHRFPTTMKARLAWCDSLNVDVNSVSLNDHVVCSAHFSDFMFTGDRKKLFDWAIPKMSTADAGESTPLFQEMILEINSVKEEKQTNTNSQDKDIGWDDLQLPFSCDMCSEKFPTRNDRNSHIANHFQPHQCVGCGETFVGDRKFEHHRRNKMCATRTTTLSITYECFICHAANFFSSRSLKLHMTRRHKEKSVQITEKCPICRKAMSNIYILKAHIKEVHTNSQNYECDVCGKRFNRKSNMNWHRLIHENKMPCECKLCGKAFRTISGLNLHKRMHTGEKPYKCDLGCDKSYAYNTDLKRHKRSVHGIIDKEFPCQHCSQIFYENKYLKNHITKKHPEVG